MDRYIQKLTKRPRLSEDPSVPVQSSSTTVATGSQSYIGDVDEPNHESEERVEPSHGIFLPHSNDPVMDDYEVDSRDISHDAIEDEVELEFKAVIVLPTITHNYPYGNYVGNAPVGKVITLNT